MLFGWLLAFHIIFVVCWFAGLFYLPRLFVYQSMEDRQSPESKYLYNKFNIMAHKLFHYIMTPSLILTCLTGIILMHLYYLGHPTHTIWIWIKLLFVGVLILFHIYCGKWLKQFKSFNNIHSEKFYRIINEIPTICLIIIIILAVLRP